MHSPEFAVSNLGFRNLIKRTRALEPQKYLGFILGTLIMTLDFFIRFLP